LSALNSAHGNNFYVNLTRIYSYFKKQLYEATDDKDAEKVKCVIHQMMMLRNAWNEMPNQ
jgi:flagellin-specific chaperone FliS